MTAEGWGAEENQCYGGQTVHLAGAFNGGLGLHRVP